MAYLVQGPDRFAVAAVLSRLADIVPWLSDAELGDLACCLADGAKAAGPTRVAIVASQAAQLAERAGAAVSVVLGLTVGTLAELPGIFAADRANGRVTLLMSDTDCPGQSPAAAPAGSPERNQVRWLADGASEEAAHAVAALFAAGALDSPELVYARRPARPMDIWRKQVFLARQGRPRRRDEATAAAGAAAVLAVPPLPGPRWAIAEPAPAEPPQARCYVEELRPLRRPVTQGEDDRPWRVTVAGGGALRSDLGELFRHDPGADRALVVLGAEADPDTCAAALRAAGDAIRTGRLLVLSQGPGLSGFWAALHAEHPALGITVLRMPASAAGLRAARGLATAEPGELRELVLDAAGQPGEAAMVPAALPGSGAFPLSPDDVMLVSRVSGGGALVLAQVLACCGAAVAVLGPPGRDDDGQVVAGLAELRTAGARVSYQQAGLADPAAQSAAVRHIERRLGPVTAIGHAVAIGENVPLAGLTETRLRQHLTAATAGLGDLVSNVDPARLKLIATFGSAGGCFPVAGQGLASLASTVLAGQADRLADSVPGCRAVHVDWPGWTGPGQGQHEAAVAAMGRAAISPIGTGEAARLLLRALATPGRPHRIAVRGRAGGLAAETGSEPARGADSGSGSVAAPPAGSPVGSGPASSRPASAAAPEQVTGRFLEVIRVHNPAAELVCEAGLSLRTDPYLADYQVDGMPVLPPTMAIEAMAQAASLLAGRPLRSATGVSMRAPVAIPAGPPDRRTVIRIRALRLPGAVTVTLRCEESGFGIDHFRASFCCADDPARPGPAGRPGRLASGFTGITASVTGLVDGPELYGPLCFQTGRFRRVAMLPEVTSRSCRALARGADDKPWFGAGPGGRGASDLDGDDIGGGNQGSGDPGSGNRGSSDPGSSAAAGPAGTAGRTGRDGAAAQLVLGSPGLADATLHVLQACVPDRRLLPARCESVTFGGRAATGAVEIRAVAVPAGRAAPAAVTAPARAAAGTGAAGASAAAIPRQADGRRELAAPFHPADQAWDVEAVDASGCVLVTWRGLRFTDAGLLPRAEAWPPSLLSVYLERGLVSLGLDRGLRVAVECGQPDSPGTGPSPDGSAGTGPKLRSPWPASVAGTGELAGFTLRVRAGGLAACGWSAVGPATGPAGNGAPDSGEGLAEIGAQLRQRLAEQPAVTAARLRAMAGCLAAAGLRGTGPITLEAGRPGDDWVLLTLAGARLGCAVAEISGVPGPVAIAIMTGPVRPPEPAGPTQPDQTRQPQATARS